MAAVLAAGPGAVLSHRSAAELWGMRDGSRARMDVSGPRHRRSTARLEVHVVARAFERDRAKDRELQVAGRRVVRVTWRRLRDDGDTIVRQIAALLG